ncbi:DNA-binding response regulator, OmpR family, contains REC and winged-helix (wHTH) domain [Halomonas caseinilytica]|uniref:DNA-binding response regulator, OmpR family, contains REC and winged-helix (WHTH) domain n=1 Tax=Halomonas caseinilytica TaxID=438744 RepID=A0A1M6SMQ7_9GAMM|nr:DNA-binding response regulator, OmpR family, contains REC and winged-helix (wHTH) domain [Halomonas caseinilytica]
MIFIAILEDDPVCLDQLSSLLEAAAAQSRKGWRVDGWEKGWHIDCYQDARTFIRGIKRRTYDLVLLDWMLPDLSGPEVLAWLDEYFLVTPPVIMVTHRDSERDVVEALKAGAEDFISKPFRSEELVARVLTTLRRHHVGSKHRYEPFSHGDLTVYPKEEIITSHGEPVKLTYQEYRLALLLLRNLNHPLSRSYLYETVWGQEESPMSRTLDVHIYRLRRKLGLNAENGWKLSSVYRYGYRLQRLKEDE